MDLYGWVAIVKMKESIDRIKRSVLKNEYSKGGLKITDVECLNNK